MRIIDAYTRSLMNTPKSIPKTPDDAFCAQFFRINYISMEENSLEQIGWSQGNCFLSPLNRAFKILPLLSFGKDKFRIPLDNWRHRFEFESSNWSYWYQYFSLLKRRARYIQRSFWPKFWYTLVMSISFVEWIYQMARGIDIKQLDVSTGTCTFPILISYLEKLSAVIYCYRNTQCN